MNKKPSRSKIETTKKLLDIESGNRLTSKSINTLSNNPELLKEYLESSLTHTFSELLFRLTHEIYTENNASKLWDQIVAHKTNLEKMFERDVGILVAALDYLTNVTYDLTSPKIMDDLRIEEAANIAAIDYATATETKADGEKRSKIKEAEGVRQSSILHAEGDAEAIKLVNEAANKYFIGNAQLLRKLQALESALENNAKIVIPTGSELVNIIGDMAGVVPLNK